MRIHPEGHRILLISAVLLAAAGYGLSLLLPTSLLWLAILAALVPYLLIINFFRNPVRDIAQKDPGWVYAPADGQVVVIEETTETEYFKDRRLQVSIFMSIFDVHANRTPIPGRLVYFRYHEGKYLVARHPKSSVENERTSVVIKNEKTEILLRQIAGYVARRIKNYLTEGQELEQGAEMGFIRFGSRVDLFFPPNTQLLVQVGDKVKGNISLLAKL